MNTFSLKISSPEGNVFNGKAVSLCVRGTEGNLTVMAGHIPFFSSVKAGECKIEFEDGSFFSGRTDGGVIAVSGMRTLLLLEGFHRNS